MATPAAPAAQDAKFIRKRQLATFLPVLVLPFMTLMFWALGGGKGAAAAAQPTTAGLNMDLPKATSSTITASKLEAYAAPVDTLRNRGLINAKVDTGKVKNGGGLTFGVGPDGQAGPQATADKSVAEAQKQLLALQQAQNGSGASTPSTSALSPQQQMELMQGQQQRTLDQQRTQLQMERISAQAMASGSGGADRATPVVAAAKPVEKVVKTKALLVDDDAVVSHLGTNLPTSKRTASFQGFNSASEDDKDANTLPAVIHESQEVVSGSLVKMRLTESAVVNGHRLAANTFIYGKCVLSGERLMIVIESLKSGSNIFPADLEVYDVDGLEGLHIPGAITRDAMKQAGAEGMGAGDMLSMSPNAATAAAGVAISAVKGIGQKKIRMVKVRLKAGYNLMLKVGK